MDNNENKISNVSTVETAEDRNGKKNRKLGLGLGLGLGIPVVALAATAVGILASNKNNGSTPTPTPTTNPLTIDTSSVDAIQSVSQQNIPYTIAATKEDGSVATIVKTEVSSDNTKVLTAVGSDNDGTIKLTTTSEEGIAYLTIRITDNNNNIASVKIRITVTKATPETLNIIKFGDQEYALTEDIDPNAFCWTYEQPKANAIYPDKITLPLLLDENPLVIEYKDRALVKSITIKSVDTTKNITNKGFLAYLYNLNYVDLTAIQSIASINAEQFLTCCDSLTHIKVGTMTVDQFDFSNEELLKCTAFATTNPSAACYTSGTYVDGTNNTDFVETFYRIDRSVLGDYYYYRNLLDVQPTPLPPESPIEYKHKSYSTVSGKEAIKVFSSDTIDVATNAIAASEGKLLVSVPEENDYNKYSIYHPEVRALFSNILEDTDNCKDFIAGFTAYEAISVLGFFDDVASHIPANSYLAWGYDLNFGEAEDGTKYITAGSRIGFKIYQEITIGEGEEEYKYELILIDITASTTADFGPAYITSTESDGLNARSTSLMLQMAPLDPVKNPKPFHLKVNALNEFITELNESVYPMIAVTDTPDKIPMYTEELSVKSNLPKADTAEPINLSDYVEINTNTREAEYIPYTLSELAFAIDPTNMNSLEKYAYVDDNNKLTLINPKEKWSTLDETQYTWPFVAYLPKYTGDITQSILFGRTISYGPTFLGQNISFNFTTSVNDNNVLQSPNKKE